MIIKNHAYWLSKNADNAPTKQKKFSGAWGNPEYVNAMQDNSAKGQEWQDGETEGSAVPSLPLLNSIWWRKVAKDKTMDKK